MPEGPHPPATYLRSISSSLDRPTSDYVPLSTYVRLYVKATTSRPGDRRQQDGTEVAILAKTSYWYATIVTSDMLVLLLVTT